MAIYPWQQRQWLHIKGLQQQHRLPHALLLSGAVGCGKADFAHNVSKSLLCKMPLESGAACGSCYSCSLVDAGTHPDQMLITPEPPENSRSKTPMLNIRINRIRQLCSQLAVTSQFEGFRIAIITDADRMVVQAANSLLKTLEEPGADTLILLTSSHPHRLPVTIRSRCQSLRFPTPSEELARHWLQSNDVQNSQLVLKLAHGAPLLAKHYAEHHLENRQVLSSALLASLKGEPSLSYAQQLSLIPKDQALSWLLDWVSDLVRLIAGVCGAETGLEIVNEDYRDHLLRRAKKVNARRVFEYYDQICSYMRADGIALNSQLLWENLLISWDEL